MTKEARYACMRRAMVISVLFSDGPIVVVALGLYHQYARSEPWLKSIISTNVHVLAEIYARSTAELVEVVVSRVVVRIGHWESL